MNSNITRSIDSFSANFKERNYKKGDIVIRGDDEPSGVYLIKSGLVKMSMINEEGTELAVNIFKPGTFFPMTWAVGDVENAYYYQTLASSRLIRVPKEKFTQFLKDNPKVLYDLTKRILIGLDGLIYNTNHLFTGSSIQKIAAVLYILAKRFGIKRGKQIEIGLVLTHQDLSHFVGLTRETTTIAINKLVQNGVVAQKQRRLIIKSLKGLRNFFN